MVQEGGIQEVKKGGWSAEEDAKLTTCISTYGERKWTEIPCLAGLQRSDKSCRRRWLNYLKPGLKRDKFTTEETDLIIELHNTLGNRWAEIARNLPGRTDNDIRNFCRTVGMKNRVAVNSPNQSGLVNPNEITMLINPAPTMAQPQIHPQVSFAPFESTFDQLPAASYNASLAPLPPVWPAGGFISDALDNAISTDPALVDPSSSFWMDDDFFKPWNCAQNEFRVPSLSSGTGDDIWDILEPLPGLSSNPSMALPSTSTTPLPPPAASCDPFALPTYWNDHHHTAR